MSDSNKSENIEGTNTQIDKTQHCELEAICSFVDNYDSQTSFTQQYITGESFPMNLSCQFDKDGSDTNQIPGIKETETALLMIQECNAKLSVDLGRIKHRLSWSGGYN
jgi:hypothetical protein